MSNDFDDKLAEDLLESIFHVSRTFRKWMKEEVDFSVPQFRVLSFVKRNDGCSIDDIAAYLGVSKPTASKIVENMRLKDLLCRVENSRDRRKVSISITDKGSKVLEKARQRAIFELKNRLSKLDNERKILLSNSLKILAELTG